MSRKTREESSGKLASQLVCEAETYTQPFRRQLSVFDSGGPKPEYQDFLNAIEDVKLLIHNNFGKSVPNFFLDNVRDAITSQDMPLVRFVFRALERQIITVLIECEIERVDPTWSKQKQGRPRELDKHIARADHFMTLYRNERVNISPNEKDSRVTALAREAAPLENEQRAKESVLKGLLLKAKNGETTPMEDEAINVLKLNLPDSVLQKLGDFP